MLATELRKTEVVMLDGFINGMRQTIEDNAGYRRIFELLYKILPIEVGIVYVFLIITAWMKQDIGISKLILVPLVVFVGVTVIRKLIDAPRPYEVDGIEPLIPKDKHGESFPSRHVVSAMIITMAGFYMNVWIGISLAVVTVLIAVMRVVAGVHYVKDVAAGLAISIIAGVIGFFL